MANYIDTINVAGTNYEIGCNCNKKELKEDLQFIYRKTANGSLDWLPNNETIKKLKGNSLVWNQLVPIPYNIPSTTIDGITITDNRDGSYTVSGTATADVRVEVTHKSITSGERKIYLRGCTGGSNSTYYLEFGNIGRCTNGDVLYGTVYGEYIAVFINVKNGTALTTPIILKPQLIDLTLMFGAGNEPSTVEEFEKLFPNAYYDYEPGRLLNFNGTSLETVGFNLWDEEWEQGGINPTTGENISITYYGRSKNYILVFPNTDYYFSAQVNASNYNGLDIVYYDENKTYISGYPYNLGSTKVKQFTTPSNCKYVRFCYGDSLDAALITANIYSICINLSDAKRNGTYEPYQKSSWDLNVSSITGKLNGTGNSVVIFPDGLKSAGNVRDEISNGKAIKRIGSVDLGSLSYVYNSTEGYFLTHDLLPLCATSWGISAYPKVICSKYDTHEYWNNIKTAISDKKASAYDNQVIVSDSSYSDATDFQTAMSGVKLYYELATPEEYILDNEFYPICNSDRDGTESIVPANSEVPYTSPMVADIQYNGEASEVINSVSENNTRINDIDSRLEYVEDNAAYKGTLVSGNLVSWDGEKLIDSGINGPVVFKGTLGTGGTITSLPTASISTEGHAYKVITDGTYAGKQAYVGDLFICAELTPDTYSWELVPSGDVPSGTVTNVATGTGLTGGPITSTGTIKANLNSETSIGTIGTGDIQAIGVDSNGKLAVDLSHKADIDGIYPKMSVGNLVVDSKESATYTYRMTAGGDREVSNGAASVVEIEGNGCAWNQLVLVENKSWTVPVGGQYKQLNYVSAGVKYYARVEQKNNMGANSLNTFILTNNSMAENRSANYHLSRGVYGWVFSPEHNTRLAYYLSGSDVEVEYDNYNLFDLTLLGIDNLTTVAEVENWLAKNIGTKPYYPYNPGTLLAANPISLSTVGQNLLDPSTGKAKLLPYSYGQNSNTYTIKNVPEGATITFTPDNTGVASEITLTNDRYSITTSGELTISSVDDSTYVCATYDGSKDTDVVSYEKHTYPFDVTKVWGKDGNGVYQQVFPNGMRGAGSAKDVLNLAKAEAVVNTKSQVLKDLGEFTIGNKTQEWIGFYKTIEDIVNISDGEEDVIRNRCDKIRSASSLGRDMGFYGGDPSICILPSKRLTIRMKYSVLGSEYSSETNTAVLRQALTAYFTSNNAVDWYELETPLVYTDCVYRDNNIDTPINLLSVDVNNWGTEGQIIPFEVVNDVQTNNPLGVSAFVTTQYALDSAETTGSLPHTFVSIPELERKLQGKQDKLTVGDNITISLSDNNVTISATDTTYSDFGASGSSHSSGLVPDPGSTAGTSKYLCEDGSWKLVSTTDNKVSQTVTTTNSNFEVLFSGTADNTDRTEGAKKNSNLLFNPSTGNLLATKLNGVTIGNSPKFTDTTYSAGANIDIDGTTISALGYLYDGSNLHEFVQGAIDSHTMSGEYSHAEGCYTTAGGDYSHTEGLFTTTTNEYEHAEGIYNLSHYTEDWGGKGTIFSVGTGEEEGKESNAIEILTDNSIYVHGVGGYEPNAGVDIDNAKTLQEVILESFDYNNLSNKPTIPTVNNATYSVKTNVSGTVTTVSDFTANQSSADDVTFVLGTNVTLTPDATNRKITISATDTKTTLAPSSTDATYPLLACSVADASTSQTTTSIFDSNLKVNPYYHSLVLGAFGSSGRTSEITASGSGSIAFGATNYGADIIASATGAFAHGYAQGGSITASGESSHAEGLGTTASGSSSHAEGYYTEASGVAAHAEGEYTVANLQAMLAVGKYNTDTNTSGYLFVVGNGTSNTRSDAFRVTSSGNCYASGAFYASSDIRKKTILSEIPLDKAYELVNKCQAVFYNWKNDDTKKLEIGLIAQEVKEYFPELVYEGGDGYLALDYSKLTVILLTVIKDLSNKVNKIDLLEKRLNSLENK